MTFDHLKVIVQFSMTGTSKSRSLLRLRTVKAQNNLYRKKSLILKRIFRSSKPKNKFRRRKVSNLKKLYLKNCNQRLKEVEIKENDDSNIFLRGETETMDSCELEENNESDLFLKGVKENEDDNEKELLKTENKEICVARFIKRHAVDECLSEKNVKDQIIQIKQDNNGRFANNINFTPNKTRSRSSNVNISINVNVENDMKNSKSLSLLTKCQQSKLAYIKQNVQFLSYFLIAKSVNQYTNLKSLIELLVTNHIDVLVEWKTHLQNEGLSHDSIRGRFSNISMLVQVFKSDLSHEYFEAADVCIEKARQIISCCAYEINVLESEITTKDLIQKGLLPKNLKKDLLLMWKTFLPLLDSIIALARFNHLKQQFYTTFVRILLFGFWSENSNGRMQAITSLTVKDLKSLIDSNYCSSNKTKTKHKHGPQLITLRQSSTLLPFLVAYVKYVRKQAVNRIDQKTDTLFLKYVYLINNYMLYQNSLVY